MDRLLQQARRYCRIAAAIVCFVCLASLKTDFGLINTYNTKANQLAVDNFRNFYTAADNKVFKFSPDGKYLYPYEEFHYGKVGMIDVVNPMKILVFYPDFMTVVTLDRFLSPLTTYRFFDLGYQNITAVGSSIDGRLWFYDNIEFKLKKIDETGKVFRESQPLNVILEKSPQPNFIMEQDANVYVNDSTLGILVFDQFGSYNKTIPLKGLRRFQLLQGQVIFEDSAQLKSYNPTTFELKVLTLPDTTALVQAVIEKDRLGILRRDKVDFYKY